jgi:hypothetical protein
VAVSAQGLGFGGNNTMDCAQSHIHGGRAAGEDESHGPGQVSGFAVYL